MVDPSAENDHSLSPFIYGPTINAGVASVSVNTKEVMYIFKDMANQTKEYFRTQFEKWTNLQNEIPTNQ